MTADNDNTPEDERTQILPKPPSEKKPAALAETIILPKGATDVPAAPRPEVTAPPKHDDSGPILPGTIINNNYEIKELISAGGMGEVFRGENAFTGDAVAIKIVLNSLANDEKVAALFMREAKVLCQLSDQAIVRYYNFVKDTNLDRFCLIMEFVDGVSLADEMRNKGPLAPAQCKNLIRRLATGLDRAHQMEVVHRDLSPDNVILRGGAIDDAVLIDFGIAKSATNVESTLHGQLAGKFKYISPEQLGHYGGEVGPRTDIYGLGLLIAAVARAEPLDMGTTVVEAVNARQTVPDLSDIDPEIRGILTHMLQPDPAKRPARMSDVIALLDLPSVPDITQAPLTQRLQTMRPAAMPVPGLREPPGRSMNPVTLTGSLEANSKPESTSPFGQSLATLAPVTLVPGAFEAEERKGRRRLILVLLAALAGGGGYYAWFTGLFAPQDITVAENTADPSTTTNASGPDTTTREGFLTVRSAADCVYATRIAAGPNSGMINALAADVSAFDGLLDAYDEAFGTRPTLLVQPVTEAQCPALDLADALRQMGGSSPVLALDNTEMTSGGSIVGRLSDRRGRDVWLGLVSAAGGVYNLTDRLTEQDGGGATFSFGLEAEPGSDPSPQLLIVIASNSPLIAAAVATDGTAADTLLPLIAAEITARENSNAGASIGVFSLSP